MQEGHVNGWQRAAKLVDSRRHCCIKPGSTDPPPAERLVDLTWSCVVICGVGERGNGTEGVVDQGVVTHIGCQRRPSIVCGAPAAVE